MATSQRFLLRAQDRRRRRHRRVVLLVLALVVLVGLSAGGGWLVLGSSMLSVDEVVVEGVHRLPADQVRQAAAVPLGDPMLTLDRPAIAERVHRLAPVAEVDVVRRWPSTVALVVRERQPAAVLVDGDRTLLVDREGVAFATVTTRPKGLPMVTEVPTTAVARLRAAVTVVAGLPPDLGGALRSASASSPDDVVLQLTRGRRVIWGGTSDPAVKVAVLRVLLDTQQASVYDVSAPQAPTTQQ